MEENAICSDAPDDVTAMKSMTSMSEAPPVPMRSMAAAGGTSPCLASSSEIGRERATAASPREVARENGMANQHNPPRR